MTFSGPTPPYSNPPIQPQNFQPRVFVISNITLGATTTIESESNMDYVIGQLVRLIIPTGYGSVQLNGVTAYVDEIPSSTEVVLRLDSSNNVNQFIDAGYNQQPQIVPIGDVNTGIISSTGRTVPFTSVPGAFINIS